MPLVLRIALIVLSLVFLVIIVRLVIKKRLMLKYYMLWMLLSIVILLVSIFPQPIFLLSNLLGIGAPSNLIFLIALGILFLIALSLSIVVTHQTINERKNLQEIAILKKELEELNRQQSSFRLTRKNLIPPSLLLRDKHKQKNPIPPSFRLERTPAYAGVLVMEESRRIRISGY